MNAMNASAADWTHIEPLLDDAMSALDDTDRAAVLLRYFENKSLREVGATLGTSDDAAQKRVSRAVERLREFFAKRGVTVGAGGLIVVISANAVQVAPVGLAVTISTAAAMAGTTASTSTAIAATKTIAMTTMQKTFIGAALVAAVGTGIYEARQVARLRIQNQTLQQQQAPLIGQIQKLQQERDDAWKQLAVPPPGRAPRLPAPRVRATAPAASDELSSSNLISRILNGENPPKLTPEQSDAFASENNRDAASLLAAFRTSGNTTLLEEAMKRFPNDPRVAFEAAFQKDAPPEQTRRWLDMFKQTAPDNAIANYLSAFNYFKSGQPDQAVQDLIAAAGKSKFQDYTTERFQGDMEAYRSAGFQEAETSMAATWGLELPQLKEMKQLAQNMSDLAASYRQARDTASAQAVQQMMTNLGTQLEGANRNVGVPLVTQLVGLAIQNMALDSQDPAAAFGAGGLTVKDRQDQIAGQKTAIHDLVAQLSPLQSRMTLQDWINYDQRSIMFGEQNAIQWLVNKYGTK